MFKVERFLCRALILVLTPLPESSDSALDSVWRELRVPPENRG